METLVIIAGVGAGVLGLAGIGGYLVRRHKSEGGSFWRTQAKCGSGKSNVVAGGSKPSRFV